MNPIKLFHKSFAVTLMAGVALAFFSGCATHDGCKRKCCSANPAMRFGTAPDGAPVWCYTLKNAQGMEARIITYGGIIQSLKVPDRNGKFGDVVLGYDTLDGYLTNSPYFGALI